MPTDNATPESSPPPDVKADLLRALPKLRVFALSLCRRSRHGTERADDLVQETAMRALANIDSFAPGSNMNGWLYTILRNEFYSQQRKRRHEIEDENGFFAARLESPPGQEGHMRILELQDAVARLTPEQRRALILVGAWGFSYEHASPHCSCATGTVKSRVNRARAKLAIMLDVPNHYAESAVAWFEPPAPPDDDARMSIFDHSVVAAARSKGRSSPLVDAG